jgi:hypothetical protein
MRVREVQLLGRKGDNNSGSSNMDTASSNSSRQNAPAAAGIDDVADDLPF